MIVTQHVFVEFFFSVALAMSAQLFPMIFEFQNGHAKPARVGDSIEVNHNKRADADLRIEHWLETLELGMILFDDLPAPVETHNHRCSFEGTHHDDDPAVFEQMRDCFDPTTDQVEVYQRLGIENPN